MKGRGAIRGCSSSSSWRLEPKNEREKEEEECGLSSLPDDVALDCLSQVSRLDLLALATVSRSHRFVAEYHDLRVMRNRLGKLDPYLYVYMRMHPEDPSPRWFVLHPMQHRLKLVQHSRHLHPLAGSCFARMHLGVYCIGGLKNDGKPTTEVTFFNAINHLSYRAPPMKMARSGASATCIDNKKIYVFGGCWDVANSSNWVEVLDIEKGTWEFLFVFTPKMPLNIQQSVLIQQDKVFYVVDEDGQIFHFTPPTSTSPPMFTTNGIVEEPPNPELGNDWFLFEAEGVLLCRGIGGRILWRRPDETRWKEVTCLHELRKHHIIKICSLDEDKIAIFLEVRGRRGPQQQQQGLLELWYAEISILRYHGDELLGLIESSTALLSDSSHTSPSWNLSYAATFFA